MLTQQEGEKNGRNSYLGGSLEKLRGMEVKDEIRELMHRYNFSIDDEPNLEAAMELFHDDALVVFDPPGTTARGKAEVNELYRQTLSPAGLSNCSHYAANAIITVSGDGTRGISYFHETCEISGKAAVAAGSYEDLFTKGGDRWKIKQRKIKLTFMVQLEEPALSREPRILELR
ncbi:MAG: nuclear transport factor 2 family protein [Candidatus Binatia bacterium]|nr:nuclear transport factor 2 family protein [Candidatus Binatia bacterium]